MDGSRAAHYENTVLITDGEPEILTVTEGLKQWISINQILLFHWPAVTKDELFFVLETDGVLCNNC